MNMALSSAAVIGDSPCAGGRSMASGALPLSGAWVAAEGTTGVSGVGSTRARFERLKVGVRAGTRETVCGAASVPPAVDVLKDGEAGARAAGAGTLASASVAVSTWRSTEREGAAARAGPRGAGVAGDAVRPATEGRGDANNAESRSGDRAISSRSARMLAGDGVRGGCGGGGGWAGLVLSVPSSSSSTTMHAGVTAFAGMESSLETVNSGDGQE